MCTITNEGLLGWLLASLGILVFLITMVWVDVGKEADATNKKIDSLKKDISDLRATISVLLMGRNG